MKLIEGDCLEYLLHLSRGSGGKHLFDCIFADPPDNIGLKYQGFVDKRLDYYGWLGGILYWSTRFAPVVWLSYYHLHHAGVFAQLERYYKVRMFIWRFAFGQYRESDSPNGYRPILRLSHPDWKPLMTERVPSLREKIGDLRATGKGRVPDDVWEYSRVQGNCKERRAWHPTQHPEDLYRRIMRMSIPFNSSGIREGRFLDLFAGTGTCFRAAWDGIDVTGVERSPYYCSMIREEFPSK